MSPVALSWTLVLLAGVNSTIGNLMLKQSRLISGDKTLLASFFQSWFIGGLVFYGINVVLFAKALDHLPVSLAYPVLAVSSFGLLILASSYIFGEDFNITQWVGFGLILVGVFLMSRN